MISASVASSAIRDVEPAARLIPALGVWQSRCLKQNIPSLSPDAKV